MLTRESAERGRHEMAEKCQAVAAKYTPTDLIVETRKGLTGRAWYKPRRISAPKPVTRRALHIYLHEIGHITLHANSRKPVYVKEYEAEQFAFEIMRHEGIAVPTKSVTNAKSYVAHKIGKAFRRGAKYIDPKIAKWCGVDVVGIND
jgi:hypothetical protein